MYGDQALSLSIQHWNEMNPRQVAKVIIMQHATFINHSLRLSTVWNPQAAAQFKKFSEWNEKYIA